MSDTATTTIILLTEFALAFSVIIIAFMISIIRRQQKNKFLVRVLITNIKQTETDRKSKLTNLLNETYGIADAEVGKTTEALILNEKTLYNNVIKSFLGQDRELITKLDKDVEALTNGYHDLALGVELSKQGLEANGKEVSGTCGSVKVIKQQNEELKQENEALQKKNETLQTELNGAMKRMESMLKEYASMYAGGQKEIMDMANKRMELKGENDADKNQSEQGESTPRSDS
jgi:hypothetical protein